MPKCDILFRERGFRVDTLEFRVSERQTPMKEKAMHGKPHVRFDEGGVAAATPMRGPGGRRILLK